MHRYNLILVTSRVCVILVAFGFTPILFKTMTLRCVTAFSGLICVSDDDVRGAI